MNDPNLNDKINNFSGIQLINRQETIVPKLADLTLKDLSGGDTMVRVAFSSINYKDRLAFQANSGVVHSYPIIPGIYFSGVIISSKSPQFVTGMPVIMTGYQVGVSHSGGLAEYAQVPAKWLVPLPSKLTIRSAMALGTAALSISELLQTGLDPNSKIIVTGGTGGVGSIALAILDKLGFKHTTALVHDKKTINGQTLHNAEQVVSPADIATTKLMDHQKFDYALDTIGGSVLVELIPYVSYGGAVTVCGNIISNQINTNILPFIIRGIRLIGIDSVNVPIQQKKVLWQKLSSEWNVTQGLSIHENTLEQVIHNVSTANSRRTQGRTVVKMIGNN